ALVDAAQRFHILQRHMLIDLVNGTVERTELGHLRADVPDEPAIGGPTRGRQLGLDAGHGTDGRVQCIHEASALGDEPYAGQRPLELELEAVPREHGFEAALQIFHRARGPEAKVEQYGELARDYVVGTRPGIDVGNLPGGRGEVLVAFVPARRRQLGEGGRGEMYGVS